MKRSWSKTIREKLLFVLALVVGIIFLQNAMPSQVTAQTAETLNFQGKIVRNDAGSEGLNVSSSETTCIVAGADTCDFKVVYYDDSSGTTTFGTEEFSNLELGDNDGIFNLSLGAGDTWIAGTESTFLDVFNNNTTVYIGVYFDKEGDAYQGGVYSDTFGLMAVRAAPFAIHSNTADSIAGFNEGDFVQLASGTVQDDTSTVSSIFINKTGASGNIIQLQNTTSDVFVVDNAGDTTVAGQLALHGAAINNTYAINIGDLAGGERGISVTADGNTSTVYGVYNSYTNPGTSSASYGVYNDVTNGGGSGNFIGLNNSGTSWRASGIYNSLSSTGANGYIYGLSNDSISVTGSGSDAVGVASNLFVGGLDSYGYGNFISLSATSDTLAQYLYGAYMQLRTYDSSDIAYGDYIVDYAGGSDGGTQYGVYVDLDDPDVTNHSIYVEAGSGYSYFGSNVGIGGAAVSSSRLLSNLASNSGYTQNIHVDTLADTAATNLYGVFKDIDYQADIDYMYGDYTRVASSSAGIKNSIYVAGEVTYVDSNYDLDATNVWGSYVALDPHLGTFGASSTSTIYYGTTGGSSAVDYGIYMDGGNENYLKGELGIGIISPSSPLDVKSPLLDVWAFRVENSATTNEIFGVYQTSAGNGQFMAKDFTGNTDILFDTGGDSYVTSSLGIGDSTPASLFTVGAGDLFQVDSSGDIVKINNITYSWPATQAAGANYVLANDSLGTLSWLDSGTIAGPWTLSGTDLSPDSITYDVGIGTATPVSKLEVNGVLTVADGSTAAPGIVFASQSNLGFYRGGTNRIVMAAGSQDRYHFDINYFSGNPTSSFYLLQAASDATTPSYAFVGDTDSGLAHATADEITLVTGASERVRISSTGNVGIGDTAPTEAKLSVTGDVDISTRLALGSSASIDTTMNANITQHFTDSGTAVTTYGIYNYNARTETVGITSATTAYGASNQLLYRVTEGAGSGYGTASHNLVYTDGAYTFNYLRGSVNIARTTSTAASGQDNLAGTYSQGYNNGTGAVTTSFGTASTSFTNSTGTIGTSYGVYGISYESTGAITNGYGGYFYSRDATTNFGVRGAGYADDAATFTNTYGGYFDAYSSGASTTLTSAFGVYGIARESAGTVTNAYAGYFDAPSATGTNYGVYSDVTGAATNNYGFYGAVSGGTTDWGIYLTGEDKSYFSGSVGIGDTTPTNFKLEVTGDVGPSTDDTYDLGSTSLRWQDLYLGPQSLHIGTNGNEGILSYDTTANSFGLDKDLEVTGVATVTSGLSVDDMYYSGSVYNYTNGTLIATDIADTTDNRMIELVIEGNSYSTDAPIETRIQAYNYITTGTIIQTSGTAYGDQFDVDVFHYNGYVYFWLQQPVSFQTMRFGLGTNTGRHTITSVTNAVKPTSGVTNSVTITPYKSWYERNDGAGSGLDADLLDGANASVAASSSTIVQRHSSGYIYSNYLNTTANATGSKASHFAVQTSSDNFIRWQTPANARTSLGLDTSSSVQFGNVGIGIAPTSDLHIYDSDTSTLPAVKIHQNSTGDASIGFQIGSSTQFWTMGIDNSNADSFLLSENSSLGTTDRLAVESGGNVGIGTTNPESALHVSSTSTYGKIQISGGVAAGTFPLLQLEDTETGGSNWNIENGRVADGYLGFYNGDTQMMIDSTGKVGIGMTPAAKFDVLYSGGTVGRFDRTTNDGIIIAIRQDSVSEGTISVSGSTVSYNAFTGSHYAYIDEDLSKGILVTLTGSNQYHHGDPESEIIYGVKASSVKNDSKLLGSYLSIQESTEAYSLDNPHLVMAVGNGVMWVVDEGDNIAVGEYLISSDTSGHAMRDDKAEAVSYIVAKATENVDWNSVTETINGKKHKLISVTFESFVSNNVSQSPLFSQMVQDYENGLLGDSVGGDTITALIGDFDTLLGENLSIGSGFSVTATGNVTVAGDILLSGRILGGSDGIVDIEGDLTAFEITANKYNVDTTDVAGASAGTSAIVANTAEIRIDSTAITVDSLVFMTANKLPSGDVPDLGIVEIGDGFVIIGVEGTYTQEVEFNWWVIN